MTKKGTYPTEQAYTYRKIRFGGFVMFCSVVFANWTSSFRPVLQRGSNACCYRTPHLSSRWNHKMTNSFLQFGSQCCWSGYRGSICFWTSRIRVHHHLYKSGYSSGSGSFHHQAKIVRKTLISTVLWLLNDFLSLKNVVNVPSKCNKQKNIFC